MSVRRAAPKASMRVSHIVGWLSFDQGMEQLMNVLVSFLATWKPDSTNVCKMYLLGLGPLLTPGSKVLYLQLGCSPLPLDVVLVVVGAKMLDDLAWSRRSSGCTSCSRPWLPRRRRKPYHQGCWTSCSICLTGFSLIYWRSWPQALGLNSLFECSVLFSRWFGCQINFRECTNKRVRQNLCFRQFNFSGKSPKYLFSPKMAKIWEKVLVFEKIKFPGLVQFLSIGVNLALFCPRAIELWVDFQPNCALPVVPIKCVLQVQKCNRGRSKKVLHQAPPHSVLQWACHGHAHIHPGTRH